jgi:putative MFS transporter
MYWLIFLRCLMGIGMGALIMVGCAHLPNLFRSGTWEMVCPPVVCRQLGTDAIRAIGVVVIGF